MDIKKVAELYVLASALKHGIDPSDIAASEGMKFVQLKSELETNEEPLADIVITKEISRMAQTHLLSSAKSSDLNDIIEGRAAIFFVPHLEALIDDAKKQRLSRLTDKELVEICYGQFKGVLECWDGGIQHTLNPKLIQKEAVGELSSRIEYIRQNDKALYRRIKQLEKATDKELSSRNKNNVKKKIPALLQSWWDNLSRILNTIQKWIFLL